MTGKNVDQGPAEYEILVRGHLDERRSRWFAEMTFSALPDGTTRLCGPVADQPALHGILSRIRDLGLVLISVNRVPGSS